jgi:methionyl-tRNA formyltransferase
MLAHICKISWRARGTTGNPSVVRALFFGTPEIAVPSLQALADIADVVGVVCQPDRPAGRGLKLQSPAVKNAALARGMLVAQPEKIKTPDFAGWVGEQKADFALVLAYGRILPPAVLAGPRRGFLNLHASILPRYRGAAPISWSILQGERITGISLMQVDEGLDTGPVYTARTTEIGDDETAGELSSRLALLAAAIVREDLPRALSGELTAAAQDPEKATHAPPLAKRDGQIAWEKPAETVHNHVRGMTPWPGAFTRVDGKLLKILATRRSPFPAKGAPPGPLVMAEPGAVIAACLDGSIEILRAQLEGRLALSARALVAGRVLSEGARLI